MQSKEVVHVFVYTRLSNAKQAKEGRSGKKRQHLSANAYLKEMENQGYTFKRTSLEDIGRSAHHLEHLHDKAYMGNFIKSISNSAVKLPAWLIIEDIDSLSA